MPTSCSKWRPLYWVGILRSMYNFQSRGWEGHSRKKNYVYKAVDGVFKVLGELGLSRRSQILVNLIPTLMKFILNNNSQEVMSLICKFYFLNANWNKHVTIKNTWSYILKSSLDVVIPMDVIAHSGKHYHRELWEEVMLWGGRTRFLLSRCYLCPK